MSFTLGNPIAVSTNFIKSNPAVPVYKGTEEPENLFGVIYHIEIGYNENNKEKIAKRPIPIKFDTLYSEQEQEYKEFRYTPDLKRPISIIDPETTEEIKPILYFDEETNEVKGKCKLKPYKSYFAFEIRESKE